MADTKQLFIAFMINQFNFSSALLINLFFSHNFILREHIFRRQLFTISFAVTRKNKLRKKRLMKTKKLLRRKPKSLWAVGGRDYLFWQNLLNKKSPEWYWKKIFDYQGKAFFHYMSSCLQMWLQIQEHLIIGAIFREKISSDNVLS